MTPQLCPRLAELQVAQGVTTSTELPVALATPQATPIRPHSVQDTAPNTEAMAPPPAGEFLYPDLTVRIAEHDLYQTCLLTCLVTYDRGAYVTLRVENVGRGPAPAAEVRVMETGATSAVPPLAPGAGVRISFIVRPCDLYTFYVDPDRRLSESGEYNNWVQFSC